MQDIDVRAFAGPDVAFQDDKLTLAATIAQTGFTDEQATVRLYRDGQPVDQPSATVTADLTSQPITIQFTDVLSEPGTFQYEVRVGVLEGEADAANNQRSKTVRCVDDALRTLYVEDRPRWEWRFLRDALVRDKRIRHGFETVLISADSRASTTEREYRRAYPTTIEELERYDLIIFGDVHQSQFTREQLRLTAEFVGEHAGGFLMIAGRKNAPHSFKDTAIGKILPIRLSGTESPSSRMDPFRAVLTAAGREENALRLVADREANDSLWRRLPDLFWCYPLGETQPLATSLLVNNSLRTAAGQPLPVLVSTPYGNGTVAVLGTDNTWRWRSVDNTKYYDLFWGQVIQWLGLPRLRARKQIPDFRASDERVFAGDSVTLTAQLPLEGKAAKSIDVNCQRGKEAVQQWTLDAVAERPGTFAASFPISEPGTYRAWFADPKSGESLSVRFIARPAPTELSDPTMNRSLLAALCRQTGGELHRLTTADRILERIPTETIDYRRTRQRPLWGTPLLLFLIIAVVAGEWFCRKRVNLR